MIEHVFNKKNEFLKTEEYKPFSVSFVELYYPKVGKIIKNYIIEPDKKVIK